MKETRKHIRLTARISVSFADPSGGFVDENVGNISKGGIFIETPNPRPRGEVLELLLSVPKSKEEIAVQAEVMHARLNTTAGEGPIGMGLRFTMIEPKQKDQLKAFLEKLIDGYGSGDREDARVFLYREIEVRPKSAEDFKKRFMPNLSRGGMFIETEEEFTLFDPLDVALLPPGAGGEPVHLQGDIVHIRRKPGGIGVLGVGVQFTKMSKKQHKQIDAYIKAVLNEEE